jgi:tetratricopeptide (TPR) repeat protein
LAESQPGLRASLETLSPARTILLICLFSFTAYANSLGGDFVFDDTDQVVENQNIRSWDNLATAFTTHVWAFRERSVTLNAPPPLPYYRPLFTVMLTIEYHLFGLWPQGWHLVSLLLHILCAIGVFYVILRMSGRNLFALFASIIFAVHPVHSESVSWISGMTDPLFGVFFLWSFSLYLKAREPRNEGGANRRALVASLAMFVLAAFAKETALSLVILIFGYELIETTGDKAERLVSATRRALPYAAAALIYLVPRYLVLGDMMWKNPQAPDRPFSFTLLTLPFVICSYVAHLAWPIGLSVTYNTHFVTSMTSPRFLLPAAALSLAVAALIMFRKKIAKEVWRGLLLIFVPLLPVLNLGQVSQEEYLVFDHYLYLSVAGLGYLVATGLLRADGLGSKAIQKQMAETRRPAYAAAGFFVIALAMTIITALENRSWADSYSLWSNVARIRPDYWAAHYNAGLALLDAKRFDEAHSSLEQAIALKPDEPNVLAASGRSYDGKGEASNAVASFKRALEINPEMFEAHNDLGTVYFKNNNFAAAEASFATAVRIKPEAWPSRFNLGLCYARLGRYSDATRELERVVQAAPEDALALYELGLCYERTRRPEDAVRAFQKAGKLSKSQELTDRLAESLARLRESDRP